MLLLMILLLRLLLLLLFLEELLLLCSLATAAPSPCVVDALRQAGLGSAAAGCRGCPADGGGAVVVGGGVGGGDLGPAHPLDDAAAAVEALLVDGS